MRLFQQSYGTTERGGLSLTRKIGESILIGDLIEITYTEHFPGRIIRLNIKAPKDIKILRKELSLINMHYGNE